MIIVIIIAIIIIITLPRDYGKTGVSPYNFVTTYLQGKKIY